jgi:CHAT domain-containing protein
MAATENLSLMRALASVAAAMVLCGCGASAPPQRLLIDNCRSLGSAAPLTWKVTAPTPGILEFSIRPRGIAANAAFATARTDRTSVSPDERYGVMSVVTDALPGGSYSVVVQSRDSRDISGTVCASAQLLSPGERAPARAAQAFASAGEATGKQLWQKAFDDYLSAARSFDQLDRGRAAEARQAMAQLAYRRLHRNRDGYVLAQQALLDFGTRADPGTRSALVELQATIAIESKEGTEAARRARALELLAAAHALARAAPLGARESARLTNLRGFLEYGSGDTRAAAAFFAQAASDCQALRDWECYSRAVQNGADIAAESGDQSKALQVYADALEPLDARVVPQAAADVWDNLGRLQGRIGLFGLAETSQLNAIRLYATSNNCAGARRALSTLGSNLAHAGNMADALAYLRTSLSQDCAAIYAVAEPRPSAASAPREPMGARRDEAQGMRAACDHLPPPATLNEESVSAVFRALLAINYGALLEGDSAVAERCVVAAAAYAVEPRELMRLANASGAARVARGDSTGAAAAFAEALHIADEAALPASNQNRTTAYIGLARAALLTRRTDAARRYGTRALGLGIARGDIGDVVDALRALALSLEQSDRRADAIEILRTAALLIEQVPIDDLDAEKRATFLATQHEVFEDLTDVLIAAAQTKGAQAPQVDLWQTFATAELGRARGLQYTLSEAAADDPRAARKTRSAEYGPLLKRMAAIAPPADRDDGWRASLDALKSAAAGGVPISEPIPSAELAAQLERRQASLIEYASGRTDMYAFVIDRGTIRIVPLGSRRTISSAASALYERLHDPEGAPEDIRRSARSLAQLILWPLSAHLSRERVFFVADDSLHTTPFAALSWSQAAPQSLVVQQVESAVVPSALFLLHPPPSVNPSARTRHFELFGDPVFSSVDWQHDCANPPAGANGARERGVAQWRESLPRLPGSRTEVLNIADLAHAAWPSGRVELHLECAATTTALREAAGSGADLLHVATHGYIDAWRPRLSALALTRAPGSAGDDGDFGLLDILSARANARLVVLSGCDTSRGRLLPGEGVLGPAQAFLQSGSPAVIASYWRIGDTATVAFMRAFYKYLLTQHLPAGAALRRAQLEQSALVSAHVWSAFALFGWPDMLE